MTRVPAVDRKTGTQLSNMYFVPEIYSQKILKNFNKNSVMMSTVNSDYVGEIKGVGDTVYAAGVGDITVSDYKVNQGDVTVQDLDESQKSIQITECKSFAYGMDDVDTAQQFTDILGKYNERSSYAIAQDMDQFIYSTELAGVATANKIVATASAVTLTKTNVYEYFTTARTRLRKALALNRGYKPFAIINAEVEGLLINSDQFIHATDKGDQVIATGNIGTIAGFDVFVMDNMPKDGSNHYGLLFGTAEGTTFAKKINKVEKVRPSLQFRDVVKGLYLYGGKVLYDNCLASIFVTNG